MNIIKGKNFILRPLRTSDAKSIVKHVNDWNISRFLERVPYPYLIKDANKWLKKRTKDFSRKDPKEITFGIEIDNEIVGAIGMYDIKKGHKAKMGYWLGKKYWGEGIMTEAVRETLKYFFHNYKFRRIEAYVISKNKASARVLEKNGFELECFSRKKIMKKGKFYDTYLFAKVK